MNRLNLLNSNEERKKYIYSNVRLLSEQEAEKLKDKKYQEHVLNRKDPEDLEGEFNTGLFYEPIDSYDDSITMIKSYKGFQVETGPCLKEQVQKIEEVDYLEEMNERISKTNVSDRLNNKTLINNIQDSINKAKVKHNKDTMKKNKKIVLENKHIYKE